MMIGQCQAASAAAAERSAEGGARVEGEAVEREDQEDEDGKCKFR